MCCPAVCRGESERKKGVSTAVRNPFWRVLRDRISRLGAAIAVLIAAGAMAWILCTVFVRGGSALSWDFLTEPTRPYGIEGGGIANALLGTIALTGVAALLAVPAGILAGIFLSEYPGWHRTVACFRFCANVLMGLPSVLAGLFIYSLIVVPMGGFSGFAGAVALAVIMFPVVMRTTEEMLSMVPNALRESAYALGMTQIRTTLAIVCRAAKNGLVTGVLLAVARVSGETAPLLFTALYSDGWPTGFFHSPTANLPVLISELAVNSPFESMQKVGWGAAFVVTILVLTLNVGARTIFREKKNAQ